MNEILKKIKNFHGHLGPYVVVGFRMGIIANEKLGDDPFCKNAIVKTGNMPPISCMIDGIQLSSGCTLGKGTIKVENEGKAAAIFSNKEGKNIKITLKDEVKLGIDTDVTQDNIVNYSEKLYEKTNSELFKIE